MQMNKSPLKKTSIINLLKKIDTINLGNEIIKLENSKNRFLSKDIVSKINLPPFNNSAVDGYALNKKDIITNNIELNISNRIAAGDKATNQLKTGNVARIFTGAKMPKNSKTVVMQENVKVRKKKIIIKKMPKFGENCRLFGEDVLKGQKIFSKGDMINTNNINFKKTTFSKGLSFKCI